MLSKAVAEQALAVRLVRCSLLAQMRSGAMSLRFPLGDNCNEVQDHGGHYDACSFRHADVDDCLRRRRYAQTPLERGGYLVNGILTCGNCHTPRGPGGVFLMEKQLSGGPQTWDEPTFKVKGSNITPDRKTGIGTWSDADIKAALQTGHRPNGVQIAPIMPYAFYKVFTPGDLDAVVVYLRSVTPIRTRSTRRRTRRRCTSTRCPTEPSR
jgi:mono/diheme cytochrome c family protein